MIISIILFVIALILPDYYIWSVFLGQDASWWWSALYSVPTLMVAFSFVAVNRGFYHNTFMRIFFALSLLVVLPKLIFAVLSFAIGYLASLIVALALVLTLLYGFFFGWRRIKVKNATCASPLLPKEFEGYRILQMSDLHIGTFRENPSFISKLVKIVNDQHPDLIVFTGDLVNVRAEELHPFLSELSKLSAVDGVYSVMGNHDYCEYGKDHSERNILRNQHILQYWEEKMGWKMLMNEHVMLRRGDAEIALIGVENIGKPPFKSQGDLHKAMLGLQDGMFKVLLSHDPTHWRRGVLHQTDIALTLSGHTHAGQMKIGKFSPAKWAYNEWGGKYTEGEAMLYVSLGLGGTMPFRFGAWPEVNVIRLKKIKNEE